MRSFSLKYIFPVYIGIVLLDLNEFVTRYIGSQGALTLLILGLSFFLLLSAKPLKAGSESLSRAFLVALFGYLGFGVLAGILEGDFWTLGKEVRYYLPTIIIYFAVHRTILSIRVEKDLFRTITIATIFIAINAVFILLSIVFGIDFHGASDSNHIERAVGLYSNANRAGYVSTIGQSLALLLLFSTNTRSKNLYFGLYLLCLFAAVSTFSKGSIILSLLLAGRMIYLGLTSSIDSSRGALRKYVRRFSFLISILFLGSVFGVFNLQSKLSNLQSKRINQVQLLMLGQINDQTTTHRSELASYAFNEMQSTFFLGAGLGKFHKMDIGNGTHNIYLLILGESGLLALFLYLLFLSKWSMKSFSKSSFNSIKFASGNIVILLVFSGFAAHTLLSNKPFILTIALIIGALRIKELVLDTRL